MEPPVRRRAKDIAIIAMALLAGVGLTLGYRQITGADQRPPAQIEGASSDLSPPPVEIADGEVPPGTPASTPVEAVDRFLTAESRRDHASSYRLLSAAQRAEYGPEAQWINAHADFFPVIGHELVEERDGVVVTEVRYRSSIDEVVGLVPARAEVQWPTVQEAGGWLVDFDSARIRPLLPPESDAVAAAVSWARDHQRCDAPEQYHGALVATADLVRLAEDLCGTDGAIRTSGDAQRLDDVDANAVVSAFGADARTWGRVVSMDAPVALDIILAPVDDRWLVVGLLPA